MSGVDELDRIKNGYHNEYSAWLAEYGLSPELENAVSLVKKDPLVLRKLYDRLSKYPEFISSIQKDSCNGECGCKKCKSLNFFGDPFNSSDAPDINVPSGQTSSDSKRNFGDWAFKFMDIIPDLSGILSGGKNAAPTIINQDPKPDEKKETPWLAIGIGILVLLVIVFGIIFLTRNNEGD